MRVFRLMLLKISRQDIPRGREPLNKRVDERSRPEKERGLSAESPFRPSISWIYSINRKKKSVLSKTAEKGKESRKPELFAYREFAMRKNKTLCLRDDSAHTTRYLL